MLYFSPWSLSLAFRFNEPKGKGNTLFKIWVTVHLNLRFVFAQTFYPWDPGYLHINQTSSVILLVFISPIGQSLMEWGVSQNLLCCFLTCEAQGISWSLEGTGKNAFGPFYEF